MTSETITIPLLKKGTENSHGLM